MGLGRQKKHAGFLSYLEGVIGPVGVLYGAIVVSQGPFSHSGGQGHCGASISSTLLLMGLVLRVPVTQHLLTFLGPSVHPTPSAGVHGCCG